ncbi:DapH/DapD/GlmU-related protein [Pectobacterium sp. B1J-3]|uniref:DapH/DapD/GlmU-related protein n=1 Tax=Pectobacterium sp. B1J-3 TaxID=3385371 RepID=UPI0039061CD9
MKIAFLKECFHAEIIGVNNKFSWFSIFKKCRNNRKKKFLFFWRLASFLYFKESRFSQRIAKRINYKLMDRYNTEIELGAIISPGLYIGHHGGIVVTHLVDIGRNFSIRQNTTIGLFRATTQRIIIGDNVCIGANSCIIGDGIKIGDNVRVGAMTFINKDVRSNCTCYTKKELIVK